MICERLSDKKLLRLSQHRYSASGATLLDPLMQRYWRWLVERVVPLWWSPNAMTLVGLACNIITACLLVYYSPDARHSVSIYIMTLSHRMSDGCYLSDTPSRCRQIPAWPLLLCAIGLFVYQTLDACDGKQARRTKTSSCLGELFDHGCDAVSTSECPSIPVVMPVITATTCPLLNTPMSVCLSLSLCATTRRSSNPRAVATTMCSHYMIG
jgi:choline/ethanolamine phosphotransferase